MCKGFKQISNDFFESDYWRQSRTYNDCEAVLDIINQVRFEASEHTARIGGREVTWSQAQWPASVRFLAARWHWTEWKVRTFLSGLRRKGIIETADDQGVNMITLKKYLIFKSEDAHTPSHTLNELEINELVKKLTQQLTQANAVSHTAHTKHNNGNIKNDSSLRSESKERFKEYDWSLLPDEMRPIAEEWLSYKKEKKQTYKPRGFSMFCKELRRLSHDDTEKARLIIEQSMRSNYSGIFELKKNSYETTSASTGCRTAGSPTNEQLVNDTYDLINEARARENVDDSF